MTREEAIDVLKHNYPSACFMDLCEAVEIAIQALSAQSEPQWIPVSEKPIASGEYIVTLKDDRGYYTDTAEWNPTFGGRWQDEFFDCEYRDISNVIAWMPLPEPWGGERE